jgi:hypothetical protein
MNESEELPCAQQIVANLARRAPDLGRGLSPRAFAVVIR